MYTDWLLKMKENEAQTTLEERVVELLAEHKMTVTTAESCTGGLIAATLVNVPGASDVLNEGYITYSNEAKIRLVNVFPGDIRALWSSQFPDSKRNGEWSSKGGKSRRLLVSATGIAGPGGGTEEKPVGLVYIGCSVNGKTTAKRCVFDGNRMENRQHTVETALEMLVEALENLEK